MNVTMVLLRLFQSGEIFATWVAIAIVVLYCSLGLFFSALNSYLSRRSIHKLKSSEKRIHSLKGLQELVTKADLQKLIEEIDEVGSSSSNNWTLVIDKSNQGVSYFAKRREPKDGGPTEYLSTTTFKNCKPELLRDFYMDNEFRMQWDKTVVKHEQLEVCRETGIEVGRTVKKFPLMMAREYVLVWRLWEETETNTFYCVVKACEHPSAPRRSSCKRVEEYFSGWRIQPVSGTDACEVKILHREDVGMGREMAKMAFSRGIWSYITKMEQNLRIYSIKHRKPQRSAPDAVSLCNKIEKRSHASSTRIGTNKGEKIQQRTCNNNKDEKSVRASNKGEKGESAAGYNNRSISLITQSMFLLGWAVFLGHGSTSLGAKIAAAIFMNKAVQRKRVVPSQLPHKDRYVSKRFCIHRSH